MLNIINSSFRRFKISPLITNFVNQTRAFCAFLDTNRNDKYTPDNNLVTKSETVPYEVTRDENPLHIPVMPKEVINALTPKDNQLILDMTFGTGGHSMHLLNAASIKLLCLDRDPESYQKAIDFSKTHNVIPLLGRFSEMKNVLLNAGIMKNSIDGILIDAGYSSLQMDTAARGFSINKNGPLDMRMDGSRYPDEPTAADVVNTLDVPGLAKIFKVYGEEKHNRKIAQAIFDARYLLKSINTTHELADLVKSALGCEERFDSLHRSAHVATKVFQALRIFVNNELNELNYGIEMAYEFLKPGGRLVTLTFHSLEDRIVKRHILGVDMDEPVIQNFRQKMGDASIVYSIDAVQNMYSNKWTPIYKHVVRPTDEEVELNPRSRSAKLRAAIKNKVP